MLKTGCCYNSGSLVHAASSMLITIRRRQGYRRGMPRSEDIFFSCALVVPSSTGEGVRRGSKVVKIRGGTHRRQSQPLIVARTQNVRLYSLFQKSVQAQIVYVGC